MVKSTISRLDNSGSLITFSGGTVIPLIPGTYQKIGDRYIDKRKPESRADSNHTIPEIDWDNGFNVIDL